LVKPGLRFAIAWLGALMYGTGGALIGSMNAGWFNLDRNANGELPLLGLGAGLVIWAFYGSPLHERVRDSGGLGKAIRILLAIGVLFNVLQPVLEFAIFGTLGLGIGLICLSVAVWNREFPARLDQILISSSAAGSLMWNTETTSAFLLVGVALLWMVISFRLLLNPRQASSEIAL
jgi:hypothetical protein